MKFIQSLLQRFVARPRRGYPDCVLARDISDSGLLFLEVLEKQWMLRVVFTAFELDESDRSAVDEFSTWAQEMGLIVRRVPFAADAWEVDLTETQAVAAKLRWA